MTWINMKRISKYINRRVMSICRDCSYVGDESLLQWRLSNPPRCLQCGGLTDPRDYPCQKCQDQGEIINPLTGKRTLCTCKATEDNF